MTREEVDRRLQVLHDKSVPGTLMHEHDQALMAYLEAVVEYVSERVPEPVGTA